MEALPLFRGPKNKGEASIALVGRGPPLQPAVALEAAVEQEADDEDEQQHGGVAEGPRQLGDVLEVHPVHAGDQRRDGDHRGPGGDLAGVLVVRQRGQRERGLQDRGQQLVERADLVADAQSVVEDVAEVGAHRVRDDLDRPLGQLHQRDLQRPDGPAQLHQLPLELVDAAHVVGALGAEHRRLQLLDVLLDRGGDVGEGVDDEVGDGVQDGGGAQAQQLALVLQPAPQLGQAAVVAVPHGDHIVLAEEDHDLAGVDDLAGGGEVLVLHVPRRLEHHEQVVVVALQLGPLVGLDGVLDRQGMQPVPLGDRVQLGLGRLVEPQPDEAPGRAGLGEGVVGGGARLPPAVHVPRAVDDRVVRVPGHLVPARRPGRPRPGGRGQPERCHRRRAMRVRRAHRPSSSGRSVGRGYPDGVPGSRSPTQPRRRDVAAGIRRIKSVEDSIRDTEEPEHQLKKSLSALDLTVFGVGVIIGTGIFVLTGRVAKEDAGPAVAISFVIAGIVCGLAALCYAEFASTVPVAGSAYTFSYATLGEFVAWIIGWDLILELALGAATVAVGWSEYLNQLLGLMGIPLPDSIAGEEATFNIPAMLIVLIMTAVLVLGIKLSSRVTSVIVAIKVLIVLLVIVVGVFYVKAENYSPFIPPAQPGEAGGGLTAPFIQLLAGFTPSTYGWGGVFAGAVVVFFAFIGFDIVATAAEETRDPKRDLPRGIIGSLAICTILYVAVSLVVVGMQNYTELSVEAPLAEAFQSVGLSFVSSLISVGALAGLTSVVLILMLGQSRVLFAMSRDHLLPPAIGRVHPRYGTPYLLTIGTGVVVALLAGFLPISVLADLVNIGTLFAFILVALAVLILRRTRPDLHRSFRVPFVPVLPIVSALASLWLMLNLPTETWLRFGIWMALGLVFYFVYSHRHSRLVRADAR